MKKKVRFNDTLNVYYVTNDNVDRRADLSWMFDRMRFTDRIGQTEKVLKPVLLKKIAIIQDEAKQ